MSKISNIINGWTSLIKNENIELATKRAGVCAECPRAVKSKFFDMVNDELVEVKGMICDHCHCPLSAKVRSIDEKCPLNKW